MISSCLVSFKSAYDFPLYILDFPRELLFILFIIAWVSLSIILDKSVPI